jgi:hypothetical protein
VTIATQIHAPGELSPAEKDEALERLAALQRQLRSLVGAQVAQRNEPRVTGARRAHP